MNHPFQQPRARLLSRRRAGAHIITRLEQRCVFVEVREMDEEPADDACDSTRALAKQSGRERAPATTSNQSEDNHVPDCDTDLASGLVTSLVLGRAAKNTTGSGVCRRYELVAVDPYCIDTAPLFTGNKDFADCSP